MTFFLRQQQHTPTVLAFLVAAGVFVVVFSIALAVLSRRPASTTVTLRANSLGEKLLRQFLTAAVKRVEKVDVRTRIIFNGQEYSSPEAMPPDTRQAYEKLVGHLLEDADHDGVPDVLTHGDRGSVVRTEVHTESSFNTVADGVRKPATISRPASLEPVEEGGVRHSIERLLIGILGVAAVTVLAVAIFMMAGMDASSRSQGGRFYVAVGALVVLGGIDSVIRRLVERASPFSLSTTPTERRYALVSLLLLVASAALLFGAAWLLP